jgi:hypothetical protein
MQDEDDDLETRNRSEVVTRCAAIVKFKGLGFVVDYRSLMKLRRIATDRDGAGLAIFLPYSSRFFKQSSFSC